MSEKLERELLGKLKRRPCEQEQCRSRNEDNVEVVVFGNEGDGRGGLMCSSCLLDSNLLELLRPVERHALAVREYLRVLTRQHSEYVALRASEEWGPGTVGRAAERLLARQDALYNETLKHALEVKYYFDEATSQAQLQLRKAHLDPDFEKVAEFLAEDNEDEQERAVLTGELGRLCRGVRVREGRPGYASEEAVRRAVEEVVGAYSRKVGLAAGALREVLEVQRECQRCLLG